jgi:hypothetical protein
MKLVVALIVSLSSVAVAAAQGRQQVAPGVPLFTPRFVPNAAPVPSWYQAPPVKTARQRHASVKSRHDFPPAQQQTEIICGLRVIKKSPALDRQILAQPKHSGSSAIGRLKPPVCNPQ